MAEGAAPVPLTGTVSAVVTRADGTVEDLGVIADVVIPEEQAWADDTEEGDG